MALKEWPKDDSHDEFGVARFMCRAGWAVHCRPCGSFMTPTNPMFVLNDNFSNRRYPICGPCHEELYLPALEAIRDKGDHSKMKENLPFLYSSTSFGSKEDDKD